MTASTKLIKNTILQLAPKSGVYFLKVVDIFVHDIWIVLYSELTSLFDNVLAELPYPAELHLIHRAPILSVTKICIN